ncbi:MAG: hypothetical protein FJ306_14655 [Planctomycetes bacterium]|nr:hypothetical protein [Planctomycetota bacterium]
MLSYRISGAPDGATLRSANTPGGIARGADGAYTIGTADMAGLSITPPANSNADIVLGVTAIATELDGGSTASSAPSSLTVDVVPVSDVPTLSLGLTSVTLREDLGIDRPDGSTILDGGRALPMSVAPGAPGETAWVVISGIPSGVALQTSAGALSISGNSTTVSQVLLGSLSLSGLPVDSDADFALTVTPWSRDGTAAARDGAAQVVTVVVDAVVDAPTLGVTLSGTEDTPLALALAQRLGDTDGSEVVESARISGLPAGYALLRISGGATTTLATSTAPGDAFDVARADIPFLHVRAPANVNEVATIGVTLSVAEQASGEAHAGDNATTVAGSLVLSISPVSDAPTLSVASSLSGKEDFGADPVAAGGPQGPIAMPVVVAPGGLGEKAWAVISGIPDGVKLAIDGVPLVASGGSVTLSTVTALTTHGVAVTEFPADWSGSFVLTVTAFSRDGSAAAASTSRQVTVSVDAVADLPSVVAAAKTLAEDSLLSGG